MACIVGAPGDNSAMRFFRPRCCFVVAALWTGCLLGMPALAQTALPDRLPDRPIDWPMDAPPDALPDAVLQALRRAELPADALAAVALPVRQPGLAWPSQRWGYQPERLMQPGSTMKLVASVVALDRLGPNLRGFTELRSAAPVQNGVLQGELVLKGGADTDLSIAAFWALLLELREQGVHTVQGDLVVDRSHWHPARLDVGLPPFDDAPEWPYNVIPDALQLAGNLLPITLRSNAQSLQVGSVPTLDGLQISHAMTLIDAPCRDWDDGWQSAALTRQGAQTRIELRGTFPRNCSARAELQLIDRLELAERLFRTLWRQLGGQWPGAAREAVGPVDSRLLVRRQGRPWGEVLRPLNKNSDNALTRMLYLNLGVPTQPGLPGQSAPAAPAASAAPTARTAPTAPTAPAAPASPATQGSSAPAANARPTAELAAQAVNQWFAQHGIDPTGLVMDNGSGLSRSERISPLQLARMLQVAHAAPYAADLMMSLPTAGVDGTMRNRLKQGPAAGWARLKTGTLRNVVALAGYVPDPQGQLWAVALMINHERANRGRPVLDALVNHWATQGMVGQPDVAPGTVGPLGEGP